MLVLQGRKRALRCVAFSPDGTKVAAGGDDGTLWLCDARPGTSPEALSRGANVRYRGVCFTPDGQAVIGGAFGVLKWTLGPRLTQRGLLGGYLTWSMDLSPDGARLVWTDGLQLRCLDVATGKAVWRRTLPGVTVVHAVAFSREAAVLAAADRGGAVVRLDPDSGEDLGELARAPSGVTAVALSPDGRALACCATRNLLLWRLDPREEVARHVLGRTHFLGVAWHPSGRFFATANGDGTVDFWDAETGRHREAFDWKVGKLHAVAFSPDGDRAACCGESARVVVWDVER